MAKDKKIKVGFFMDDFYPSINGVNLVMDHYARNLGAFCDVVLVVPYVEKGYVDDFPYKVIRVKGLKPKLFGQTWSLPTIDFKAKKEMYNEHFDIIHFHSPFIMGRFAIHFARKNNIPVVGTIHTLFNYELDRRHLKGICQQIPMNWVIKTFNLCDECFTVNDAVKDIYTKYGVTNKISIIPNATDFTVSDTVDEDRDFINKKYGLNENDNVLLFVGRVNVVKNIRFILDSLKVLSDKGIQYKALFVGPLDDEKIFLKKLHEVHLEDRVIICGKIYDRDLLKKYYVRADLLLLPSYYDTSSLVQVEAASQFTPTVFIDNSPTASNIENNYNGFITRFEKNAYADKIIEVLNDKNMLSEVSRNCHDSLYKTWQDVCVELLDHYKEYL